MTYNKYVIVLIDFNGSLNLIFTYYYTLIIIHSPLQIEPGSFLKILLGSNKFIYMLL